MAYIESQVSVWEGTASPSRFSRLEGDLDVDVAVVGAGITGLTTAWLLKRAGKRVAVLEADRVGAGTTGKTTAHVATLVDAGYATIEKSFGAEKARLTREAMSGAVETIAGIVDALKIDCAFARVPGCFYTESEEGAREISEEADAALRAGLEVVLERNVALPFRTYIGLVVPNQAQFHSLRYLDGLAKAVHGEGSVIYEGTRVVSTTDGEPCVIETERGTVRTRAIVLATHTPIGVHPIQTAIAPYRSYALAARVRSALPDGLFWDTADPYNYIRKHDDLLIVGGNDHKTGHGDPNASYEALEAYTRERFDVEDIVYRWSSQLYEPADKLPSIGSSARTPHTYLATGFSGDGIPFGTVAASIIVDEIVGNQNPYADVFKLGRVKLAGAKDFVKENADVAAQFIGDRLPGHAAKLEDVRPGEGRVVHIGTKRVAAYRSEDGSLHTTSAVCTHMKCIVHFNTAERTWDCPCHGARYDVSGSILEGPATRALEKVDVSDREAQPSER